MSILVVGSVALDTIRTPLGKVRDVLGGSATYFSLSAGFFDSVNLVAVVGEDFPPEFIRLLEKKKVNLRGLAKRPGETFRWEGAYDWDFANPKTISTRLNVFADFNPRIPQVYKKSKYLFLANIDPRLQERVLSRLKPRLVACDTMNYWIENKRKYLLRLLKKVDIFLLNESEAKQLTYETNILKAGRAIVKLGPKRVIIKRGEHGALLFLENQLFSIPGFLLESVFDPTGAGDAFAGGVIGYLAATKSLSCANLKRALLYGSIMATFAVEDFSVRGLSSASKAVIEKRVREFKRQLFYG